MILARDLGRMVTFFFWGGGGAFGIGQPFSLDGWKLLRFEKVVTMVSSSAALSHVPTVLFALLLMHAIACHTALLHCICSNITAQRDARMKKKRSGQSFRQLSHMCLYLVIQNKVSLQFLAIPCRYFTGLFPHQSIPSIVLVYFTPS